MQRADIEAPTLSISGNFRGRSAYYPLINISPVIKKQTVMWSNMGQCSIPDWIMQNLIFWGQLPSVRALVKYYNSCFIACQVSLMKLSHSFAWSRKAISTQFSKAFFKHELFSLPFCVTSFSQDSLPTNKIIGLLTDEFGVTQLVSFCFSWLAALLMSRIHLLWGILKALCCACRLSYA